MFSSPTTPSPRSSPDSLVSGSPWADDPRAVRTCPRCGQLQTRPALQGGGTVCSGQRGSPSDSRFPRRLAPSGAAGDPRRRRESSVKLFGFSPSCHHLPEAGGSEGCSRNPTSDRHLQNNRTSKRAAAAGECFILRLKFGGWSHPLPGSYSLLGPRSW